MVLTAFAATAWFACGPVEEQSSSRSPAGCVRLGAATEEGFWDKPYTVSQGAAGLRRAALCTLQRLRNPFGTPPTRTSTPLLHSLHSLPHARHRRAINNAKTSNTEGSDSKLWSGSGQHYALELEIPIARTKGQSTLSW